MEPFKNLINPALVRASAAQLQKADRRFDAHTFTQLACQGLEDLEMKARALHICQALCAMLPPDFDRAAALIERALAPPEPETGMAQLEGVRHGLRGWILWPVGEFIAQRGLQQPERALQALHALTQRFTAEFAIRPFIVAHQALVFEHLVRWCHDPSPHVRRLVSEGSRPRLPWGQRLHSLVQDPSPSLPLLLALQDDPSEYVRRSVANHLNDIAKDHPSLVSDWVHRHLPGASAQRKTLLRHASRGLIKAGHPATLQAWGLGQAFKGEARFDLTPAQAQMGTALTLRVSLRSKSKSAQALELDYAVHHVKANGSTSAKVFKGWKLVLPPLATVQLTRQHTLKPVTTRRYFAGWHAVALQANGQVVGEAGFQLRLSACP